MNGRAEKQPFWKEISHLSKRLSAIDHDRTLAEVQKAAELYDDIIAALANAQKWYREECVANRAPFELHHDAWVRSATDDMLDAEAQIIFFDQTPVYYEASLYNLESIARDAERYGMPAIVTGLLVRIEEEQLSLPTNIIETLTNSKLVAEQYPSVCEMLDRLRPETEFPRSDFIKTIVGSLNNDIAGYTVASWLSIAADAGKVELFKKGNRWFFRKLEAD